MERLDIYDDMPRDMRAYLSQNGWHFNKKLCEWAVGKMRDRNGQRVQFTDKDSVDSQLRSYGVTLEHDTLYDASYVWAMAMADYYGSSMKDMASVAQYVKDYIDDIDGTDTRALDEFVGKCIGAGCPIPWSDVL